MLDLLISVCLVSNRLPTREVQTLPGMHCNHVLCMFLELVTTKQEIDFFKLFIDTESPTDNGQKAAIAWHDL